MAVVRYTAVAREDLLAIWIDIARHDHRTADRVFDRIEERCNQLRDQPQLGPARPEIGTDARALVVERWLVLYRLIMGGVQIVRIVDGARDLRRIDWPISS